MQLYKNFCKETTDENGKLTSFELVFPENYNFGYDVVDKMAELVPNDTAVVWTNPEKEEKIFTYSDISRLSNKAANVFRNHGIIFLRLHLSRTHLKPFLFREGRFSVRLILPKKLKTLPIPLKELKQKQKSLW